MGKRNYLIEGVSCVGKTTVCDELIRRGYQAIHGDRELAYQGDPKTGEPCMGVSHEHHIWNEDKVLSIMDNQDEEVTFFCGGSRNHSKFINRFDKVFILDIDIKTLNQRLDLRKDEWGSKPSERELILKLYHSKEDLPKEGIIIDATQPVDEVADKIIQHIITV